MQIPKQTKRPRKITRKHCFEPGCKKHFRGIAVTKYCRKHRNPKNRARKIKTYTQHDKNVNIKHSFSQEVLIERACLVCGKPYKLKLIPKQTLYPSCCDEHRMLPPEPQEKFKI